MDIGFRCCSNRDTASKVSMLAEPAARFDRGLKDRTTCPQPEPSAFSERFVKVSPGLPGRTDEATMHQIIYLVGLIVVILAILSFFGLR
jgi:hypothetical protein